MANNLTGEFEAALQVSIRQINGMLATLHQNGGVKDASPKLLHSQTMRLGDAPPAIDPYVEGFQTFLRNAGSQFLVQNEEDQTWSLAMDKLPPGMITDAGTKYAGWRTGIIVPLTQDFLRGRVEVQISSPTLSVQDGSTSEITVVVYIHAHFYPDDGSQTLPAPVHGSLNIAYEVSTVSTSGGLKLKVVPTAHDNKIKFHPLTGTLNADEAAIISGHVRKIVRENFQPTEVHLPPAFKFSAFRAIVGDSSDAAAQALAFPIFLSKESEAAGGDILSLNNLLLDGKDFALAVSKEYVNGIFQPLLNSLVARISVVRIIERVDLRVDSFSATYDLQLTSGPTLTWNNDSLNLSLGINAHTESVAPDANISFSQTITLNLDVPSQGVSIQPVGDPRVGFSLTSLDSVLPDSVRDDIQNKLINLFVSVRDQAFLSASANTSATFAKALSDLRGGLRSFDSSSYAKFTKLQLTPDGIIVRGDIGTAPRTGTYAHFHETDDGYNALETWVPGGRVKKLTWGASGITTRVVDQHYQIHEHTTILPVPFGPDPQGFEEHGFVRSRPDYGLFAQYSQVCLSVEGTQISQDGIQGQIGGFYSTGGTCAPKLPERIIVGWKDLRVTDFGPPGPVESPLEHSIISHFEAVSDVPLDREFSTNHVLFFPDMNAAQPLQALVHALDDASRRPITFAVVVILPLGTFKLTRGEFDKKMGLSDITPQTVMSNAVRPTSMRFTEDYEAGWSEMFAVKPGVPSTFIINARGEFAWRQEGALDPGVFGSTLEKHALPAPPLRTRLLQMDLKPGDAIPDVAFQDDRGEFTALRRLRGRRTLLNFWQSWSAPSLQELGRLQAIHEKGGPDAPLIFAHSGDRDSTVLSKVRSENKLSIALAHDPQRQLARQLKIRCWPTTISINEDGIVDHIQYGMEPQPRRVPAATA